MILKASKNNRLLIKLIVLSLSYLLLDDASFASTSTEGIQVYQKTVHLSKEHKQKLADDISRYRHADNLWDVLRDEFSLPHEEDNPVVQEKIEWFMHNQDYVLRSASRAAPYLYYILQQVKMRHLPAELVLLPIIESGYNPFNVSNVGAVGIWQLMPDTASGLGIKRDFWYDGRRDIIASTRAALNYLAYLQSFFEGNWLLAIAAYNTGEGNVLSAIKRNIRDGRDTDFWSLPLAQETKDYVPSLLALAIIISNPAQYPIYFPLVHNAPYLAQVDAGMQINLQYAAQLAGISYKKLIQLNPGFNRLSTSSTGPYKLVLPIENVEQFTENLARSPLNHEINWIHYRVKAGDTLPLISKQFNIAMSDIRKMNHLSKNNIHPGTNLLIPNHREEETSGSGQNDERSDTNIIIVNHDKKSETTEATIRLDNISGKYTLQPGDTVYMVRSKDTFQRIAKRFHITTLALRAANQLYTKKLSPGKHLIIPTHIRAQKSIKLEPGYTIYMVRHGDTMESIANKFHMRAAMIRLTNLLSNDSVKEGEELVIPTPQGG